MASLTQRLRQHPEALPGAIATALFVALAATEGGFNPTTWYPAAVFTLGLAAVSIFGLARAGRIATPRGQRIAIACLAAFTAWTFLSIIWAEVPAVAWEGANRTLLYLIVFGLFAVMSWGTTTGAALLGAHSVAIAALALYTVGDLAAAADPELGLIRGRLVEPTGYQNATAALFLASFFPALLLASRREVPWWARAALLPSAGILLGAAILPQSRGAAIVLPLMAIAFVALSPGRVRLILTAAPVVLAVLLASPPLFDVYSVVVDGGDVQAAFDDAFGALWMSALALLVIGAAIGLAERRLVAPPAVARATTLGVAGLVAIAAVGGGVAALNETGDPVQWLDDRWEDFKSGDPGPIEAESRFGGTLGSNRYDFWRVALDEFADEPVTGIGMDQFAVDYVRERESDEEPANPHSVVVKVLSQTGLVGALLFGAFLVAALAGAVTARVRAGNSLTGAVAAGATISFAYWLVHGSADWFWEFPGLTMPAVAWLAMAGSLAYPRPEPVAAPASVPRPGWLRVIGIGVTGLVLAVALATFVFPWGAARDVEIASDNWPADPQAAFDRLDRARSLNPLDGDADAVAGTIAVRLDDPELAESYFTEAVERNSSNWYAQLMLGSVQAASGEPRSALAHLEAAAALTPDDPLVRDALRRARAGDALSTASIDRELQLRVCARVGRTEATPDCR
jgi:hypothetical protein